MTEWLKMVIEAEGYEVRTALIGTRGEEIFKQWRPDVVVTDLMLPDLDGIALLRRLKEIDSEPGGHHHQRPGHARPRGRGGAGGRVLLPREAGQPGRPDGHDPPGHRADAGAGRAPAAQGTDPRPVQLRQHRRPEQEDEGPLRAHRERGGQRRQHPDPGRERHRQGADRQRDSLQLEPRQGAVHQDQLRGDPEGPDRERAVRLQEGRVHRRATPTRSASSRWRRAARCCSTRSARCRRTCRPSCCACCRSASTGRSAATGSSTSTSGSSARRTSTSTSRCAKASCARICTSASTRSRCACRRCASAREDIPLLCNHFLLEVQPAVPEERPVDLARPPITC